MQPEKPEPMITASIKAFTIDPDSVKWQDLLSAIALSQVILQNRSANCTAATQIVPVP